MKETKMILISMIFTLSITCINGYSQYSDSLVLDIKNFAKGGYSIFDKTMVDMSWQDIEKSISKNAIVLFPIAVIEEHGPHMNCGPDIYQIYLATKMIKWNLEKKGIETLIVPPVYWGIADIGKEFPGNFTIREETFKYLLHDIFISLKSWGVNNVVVFDGHGEPKHNEIIREAILNANTEINLLTYFCVDQNHVNKYQQTPFKDYIIPVNYKPSIKIDCKYDNHHADCHETGVMAGFYPEMVDTVLARKLEPTNFRDSIKYKSPRDITEDWYKNAKQITPLGYFGDPASFDANKSVFNFFQDYICDAEAIAKFFSK